MDAVTLLTLALAVAAWLALIIQWRQFKDQRKELKARIVTLEEIEKERFVREEESRRRDEFENESMKNADRLKFIQDVQYNEIIIERALNIYHLYATLALSKWGKKDKIVAHEFLNATVIYYGKRNMYDGLAPY
ncbi:MAG: hypothetical protein RBT71_01710 [Flavobacteriales bacterium]|jgi:hypothetical protein|nr:hypothetical protein [Flavobacteriales bacterium]